MARLQRRWRSLRARLLVALLALSLVPLLASNAVGYLRTRAIVEDLVERYLDGLAGVQASHVRDRIGQRGMFLAAIASGNRFLEAAVHGGMGTGTEAMGLAVDEASLRAYLGRQLDDGASGIDALALITLDGRVVASSRDPARPDVWVGIGEGGHDLLRGGSPATPPILRLSVPVSDPGGDPVAILAATIPFVRASDFLEIPEHIAGSIESFVLDAEGLPLFVSHPHGGIAFDRPLESPLVRLPPGSHARYRDREGVDVMGSSATLPGLPWIFVTEIPAEDALGDLQALRVLSQVVGGWFALLVVLVAWFLAARIVTPLQRLVGASRTLATGDLSIRVRPEGATEIEEMATAFNEMATELEASQRRIERLHQREIERAGQLATVGELASGIAHEIKNPLVGISNGLDLVMKRVSDPSLEPITIEMRRQLSRMEGTIRDLLAFARPPAPALASTSANELVRRAVVLVEPSAIQRGLTIAVEPDSHDSVVRADPELLRQGFVNLLMNAVAFSPPGGVVRVTVVRSGSEVRVIIADDGPGMDAEHLAQVFKPFFTTRASGTGLGLPITRGIVEKHGGRIDIETHPGEGAAFLVSLPLAEAKGDG